MLNIKLIFEGAPRSLIGNYLRFGYKAGEMRGVGVFFSTLSTEQLVLSEVSTKFAVDCGYSFFPSKCSRPSGVSPSKLERS